MRRRRSGHAYRGTCGEIFRARSTAAELAWSAESLSTATCTVLDLFPAANSTVPPPVKRMPSDPGGVGSGTPGSEGGRVLLGAVPGFADLNRHRFLCRRICPCAAAHSGIGVGRRALDGSPQQR